MVCEDTLKLLGVYMSRHEHLLQQYSKNSSAQKLANPAALLAETYRRDVKHCPGLISHLPLAYTATSESDSSWANLASFTDPLSGLTSGAAREHQPLKTWAAN